MFSGFEHCSLRLYLVPLCTEANVENSQVTPWLNIPAFFEQQVLLETFLQRSHQMRQVLVEQHCSAHSQVRFCRLHFEGLWLCKMCIGQQRGFAVFSHLICFRLLQSFNPKCAQIRPPNGPPAFTSECFLVNVVRFWDFRSSKTIRAAGHACLNHTFKWCYIISCWTLASPCHPPVQQSIRWLLWFVPFRSMVHGFDVLCISALNLSNFDQPPS